jgi:hypothetical protein
MDLLSELRAVEISILVLEFPRPKTFRSRLHGFVNLWTGRLAADSGACCRVRGALLLFAPDVHG